MGITKVIPLEQRIINMINAKRDFTHRHDNNISRYVVGVVNCFEGHNPSLQYKDIYKDIYRAVDVIQNWDGHGLHHITIGGWFDDVRELYCVDMGTSTNNLDCALYIARICKQTAIWDSVDKKVIRL